MYAKALQQAFNVRHVTDKAAQWSGGELDECGSRHDLIFHRHRDVVGDIENFQLIASLQVFVADLPCIDHCASRQRGGSANVEPKM